MSLTRKRKRILLMLALIPLLLIAVVIQTQNLGFTGYATTSSPIDCSDTDGDLYYSDNCPSTVTSCATENLLITSSSDKRDIEVYQNQIVYKDNINGNWDIFHYDIDTDTTTQLSTSTMSDSSPKFYGNYVVWQSLENGNWDIFMYDLSTSTLSAITTSLDNEILPDIYDNTIVWAGPSPYGDWDIYSRDISTGTNSRLIAKANDQSSPRIHSDYLVYTEGVPTNLDIYLYQISTGTTTQVTSDIGRENAPEISDTYIVWQTDGSSTWDIYAYNIASTTTTTVSADTSYNERLPKVYSNEIVWMDDRNGVFDVFHYDLTTDTTTQVTQATSNQNLPAIWDSSVYWSDDVSGYDDIYSGVVSDSCTYLSGDCDDSSSTINPGATETCDSLDNDCDGEIDEGCDTTTSNETTTNETTTNTTSTNATTACLTEGTDYNIWTDSAWSYVLNSAGDSESISLLSYGDVSCDPSTIAFYIFSTYYDDTYGTYTTDYLYDTLDGTLELYSDDGLSLIYADWTTVWPGEDTYLYYILATEDEAVLGDTLYICETSECTGESITISDAEDYLTALTSTETTEEEDTTEEYIADDEEIDCDSEWDCSNVEWSDCVDGYSSRDLYECTTVPTSDECWADEYVPSYEQECYEDSSGETVYEEEETTEEVPIFSWINLIIVSFILTGYYFYRERSN